MYLLAYLKKYMYVSFLVILYLRRVNVFLNDLFGNNSSDIRFD